MATEKRRIGELNCFVCFECERITALENMKPAPKESSCIPVQLCSILFSDTTFEKPHISPVQVLQKGNKCASLVLPPQDKKGGCQALLF